MGKNFISWALILGMKNGTITQKQLGSLKTKHLPYNPAITFPDIYPREMNTKSTQKPIHDVYTGFVCEHQELGATQRFFNG